MDRKYIIIGGVGVGLILLLISAARGSGSNNTNVDPVALAAVQNAGLSMAAAPGILAQAVQVKQLEVAQSSAHDQAAFDFLKTVDTNASINMATALANGIDAIKLNVLNKGQDLAHQEAMYALSTDRQMTSKNIDLQYWNQENAKFIASKNIDLQYWNQENAKTIASKSIDLNYWGQLLNNQLDNALNQSGTFIQSKGLDVQSKGLDVQQTLGIKGYDTAKEIAFNAQDNETQRAQINATVANNATSAAKDTSLANTVSGFFSGLF